MSPSIPRSALRNVAMLAGAVVLFAPTTTALPQTASYRVLEDCWSFNGAWPRAGIIQGTDGAFYGTTGNGGTALDGSVFKMNADGSSAWNIYDFSGSDGLDPTGLMQGSDGALYGTTYAGGAIGYGCVFKIQTDGSGFTDLRDFDGVNDGGSPTAALIQGSDGYLYGTANSGGTYGLGTAFRMRTDGSHFSVICNFDGTTLGSVPEGSLMEASNGDFYATATYGGAHGDGTICQFHPIIVVGGVIFSDTAIYSFDDTGTNSGKAPYGALLQGADGSLYGTASGGGSSYSYGTLYRLDTDGTGFKVLKIFDGIYGANPYAHGPLVQLADGSLCGTTWYGGAHSSGTAFKIAPDGSGFADLHDFDDFSGDTGSYPSDLMVDANGNLYGTTVQGEYGTPSEFGVVFELVFDPASWSNYGSGLPGTQGLPGFVSNANPVLGTTITLTIGNSLGTPTFGIVLAGLKEANVPYKGGTLLVTDYVVIAPMTLAAPTTSLNFSLPNDPTLAGLEVDLQTLESDPGAVKGTSLTPGLKLLLGW